ncbi:hypothetical protein G6O67_003542 [Ophiocordyceps sinensis]|uniref:Uncharacterized protein n=1 Tax=Ophiocordyceps sinensis TaxID=72228 RepID=A0A8H4PRZ9_9HYPO|nr:hypothetical protein G6O67_003542 [Ophiocordyceps sinensis]
MRQVATFKGKRTFRDVDDGEPKVSDQVLAQMVGEALTFRRYQKASKVSKHRERFIKILAVTHYVKFFHFCITDDFIQEYETVPTTSTACCLRADSTIWFNIKDRGHGRTLSATFWL